MENNRKINDFEGICGFKFDDFVVFHYYKINDFGVNKWYLKEKSMTNFLSGKMFRKEKPPCL